MVSRTGSVAVIVASFAAPARCVVVSVLVQPGDTVGPGDALVVLEAMKMETVVRAEVGGRVREVVARSNEQVGAGDPLVVVDVSEADPRMPQASPRRLRRTGARSGRRRRSRGLCAPPRRGPLHAARLRRHAADTRSLAAESRVAATALSVAERRRREDEVFAVFVDVAALFRRLPVDDEADFGRSRAEYLFTYLRDLAGEGRGLPEKFMTQLRRTLQHYGVETLEPSLQLEQALYDIARSNAAWTTRSGPLWHSSRADSMRPTSTRTTSRGDPC